MAYGIIYLIINKETNSKYVGKTVLSMNKRWREHISEANRMSPTPLHKAFRQYGVDKFTIKQIDECDESILDQREEYWIKQYDCYESKGGYNANALIIPEVIINKVPDKIKPKQSKRKEPWGFMLKENRGTGKHSSRKVLGINIETGEEKIWNSFSDAALEVSGNKNKSGNIHDAIKNGTKAYGYRWRRLDHTPNKTPICGVHKRTWEKIYFDSINEAARHFGVTNTSGIQRSLKNPHKYSYRKYYWFYE
jgi:group I intron endonuclease